MPSCWYDRAACADDDFLFSICTNRKPYFMIYIYDRNKLEYTNYIKGKELDCLRNYGKTLEEILTDGKEAAFIEKYYHFMPVSDGKCTMNRICHHVEEVFKEYKLKLSTLPPLDLSYLKYDVPVSSETKQEIIWLANKYVLELRINKNKPDNTRDDKITLSKYLERKYKYFVNKICPNEKELVNIALDIGLESNFIWDCVGELIVERIKEVNDYNE